MTKVLKKGKRKQAFRAAKIRKAILMAAKDARVSAARRASLARRLGAHIARGVKGKATVRAANIRKAVLAHLGKHANSVARAWRNYEKRK